jgi:23S rRNA pseudouridine1911/1915/1917 synthase
VEADTAGQRLDRYLAGLETDDEVEIALCVLSRARIQRLIERGAVRVNGSSVRRSHRLRGGEIIEVEMLEPEPLELTAEPMPLAILFEDEHVIAVAKPAGLVVHPGAGHRRHTLVHGLIAHCRDLSGIGGVERPGIVHRLDRDTSGVIVIAKSDVAHMSLSRQFAERQVTKEYVAFVLGVPTPARATLDTLYGRHPTKRTRFTTRVRRGKRAVTTYAVVASAGGISRLDVTLATGRTHQIRVHLSEMGHPIVGDPEYGGRQLMPIRDRALREIARTLGRQALHARRLSLTHPATGEPLELEAPLPAELQALWQAMRDIS